MIGFSILHHLIGPWQANRPVAEPSGTRAPADPVGAQLAPMRQRLIEEFRRGIDTGAAYRALNELDTRTMRNAATHRTAVRSLAHDIIDTGAPRMFARGARAGRP